jgi:hypothetical protein
MKSKKHYGKNQIKEKKMAMGRSQMRKQVEGQLRGARKIKKVIKGLSKASKTHAGQAKTLRGVINGSKKRNGKKA